MFNSQEHEPVANEYGVEILETRFIYLAFNSLLSTKRYF